MSSDDGSRRDMWWPFMGGVLAGIVGSVVYQSLRPRRALDPRLIPWSRQDPDLPPTVLVPGILGSELLRPDGTHVWLNIYNALGSHDLSLPCRLPLAESRDDLVPGGLLGVDAVLPRLFGFTEYADLLELLEDAGFRRAPCPAPHGAAYCIFSYDWRRDLVESARRLHESLEEMADARGDANTQFNVIGHSMGGLVARYYLRYGTAEPHADAPVTWAGARRIRNLVLVATPNAGGIPALDSILNGNRVGLSSTTLARAVVAGMPSIYQLLPPAGSPGLLDHRARPLADDLHDPAVWQRHGWGPYAKAPRTATRSGARAKADGDPAAQQEFLTALLGRARAFHAALARTPQTPCPARVIALGGDCLPTLARAVVPEQRGQAPRFEPWTRAEAAAMFEAGDGRVTRSSVLASHLPGADDTDSGSGLPEIDHAFFGSADHHGIYGEPTFQSVLLRLLLRPLRRVPPPPAPEARAELTPETVKQ
jgi:pimeloyl-ACP methyl ester carboxylesterase